MNVISVIALMEIIVIIVIVFIFFIRLRDLSTLRMACDRLHAENRQLCKLLNTGDSESILQEVIEKKN